MAKIAAVRLEVLTDDALPHKGPGRQDNGNLHLSEFKVKEGDHVKRGQKIGLSGGTGRATGPHLHVAVRWQGTYLDPAPLLQLQLP